MNYSLDQQIVNFIDENRAVTFSQVSKQFDFKNNPVTVSYFEQLLSDGAIRQIVADKNLGTYQYVLAA